MKSFKNYISFLILLTAMFSFMSCEDDNNDEEEQVFDCCGNTSLDNLDVNNLDESLGEIVPHEVITVNGDAINDMFFPTNIQFYPNNQVTIFNSNDEIVFSETGYGQNGVIFPDNPNSTSLPEGTYRYIIVVENEQTYVNNGFFCLIKPYNIEDLPEYEGQFTTCVAASQFDPFLF